MAGAEGSAAPWSRGSGASAGWIWLSYFLSLAIVVAAAKFHSLLQSDGYWADRIAYAAASAIVSSSLELLVVALLAGTFAAFWVRTGSWPARAGIVLAAILAWLTIWSVNLINAEVLPRAYTTLSVGLLFLADVIGGDRGLAPLRGWISSKWLWLVAFGMVSPVLAGIGARLLLLRISARQAALLIAAGTGAVLLADRLVSPTADPWGRSGTLAFARSARVLFAEDFARPAEAVEPLPSERIEAGIAERLVLPPFDNAILIVLESVSARHLRAYGGPESTEFRAALRKDALIVERAYAHALESNRSSAAIFSGTYPLISYWGNGSEGRAPGLPAMLEAGGIRTAFFSSDLRYERMDAALARAGFGTIRDQGDRSCAEPPIASGSAPFGSTDRCMFEDLEAWIDTVRPARFFGVLWTYQTHYPYYARTGGRLSSAVGRPDLEIAFHRRAIAEADALILDLLGKLADAGIAEETLVIVTADHGEAFSRARFGKRGLDEEGVRIPLILINPRFANLRRFGRLAGHIDIAPTLAHGLGFGPHPSWQGQSLFRPAAERPIFFSSLFEDVSLGYRFRDRKVVHQLSSGRTWLFKPESPGGEERDHAERARPELLAMEKRRLFAWAARSSGRQVRQEVDGKPGETDRQFGR